MSSEKEWIGVSDLMSVLMMVFLFIAVLFMLKVQDDQKVLQQQHAAMRAAAQSYDTARNALHRQISDSFDGKLQQWNAEILADGAVRFSHPRALFAVGSSELSGEFKNTLRDFFPRYIALLSSVDWRDEIREIRIEGHTSSDWGRASAAALSEEARYIRNAKLSQQRAYAVLEYVYQLPAEKEKRMWLRRVLRATGASSAAVVLSEDGGEENVSKSRRVEFHAITAADEKIYDILKKGAANSAR